MTGIYSIYNYEKNKIYIGQSIDIDRRWQQNIQKANDEPDTSELYRDLRNAPFKMDFKILEICSEKELNEREQHHINSHQIQFLITTHTISNYFTAMTQFRFIPLRFI